MNFSISVFLGTLCSILAVILASFLVEKKFPKRSRPRRKTWWLIAHIFFVVLYFSGLLGTLLLSLSTAFVDRSGLIYAAHLFIQFFDWFLIIPGAFGSLITGFGLVVGTWGITRHYWVIAKWVGNSLAILFGAMCMRVWIHDSFPILFADGMNPLQNPVYVENRRLLVMGTLVSLFLLTFLVVISYLKPWGKRKKYRRSRKSSAGRETAPSV
ncbi:MAG: DUF2269 domain-containing protein [Thermoactinomycetaceae bacterium]|nr:DUF2269 domain-containing protein [Bacillota bacterium]MBO2533184.1 DUF2269 domain-containing protein [Thermoactinomycetaceae bacterium]